MFLLARVTDAARQAPVCCVELNPAARHRRTVLVQAVVDTSEDATAVVLDRGVFHVQSVLVLLGLVEVADDVAVAVDDLVQVPSPCLRAFGGVERRTVTRFVGVVAEHWDCPGRVGAPLGAEEVLRSLDSGDLPVLAVVVPVATPELALDLRTVVVLGPPDFRVGCLVADKHAAATLEGGSGVVVAPAQVSYLGRLRVAFSILGATAVGA